MPRSWRQIGAINPNLFQDDDHKFGSLANPSAAIRRKAIAHVRECIDIARQTGSTLISMWLADGTNYAGGGADPVAEYAAGRYQAKIERERVGGTAMGW